MITTLVYREGKLASNNPPVEALPALRAEPGVMLWIDLDQPTPGEVVAVLENVFAFHPLTIEECLSETPFPRLDDYDDYLYLVTHAVTYSDEAGFQANELDLFLGANFLVSYHRLTLPSVSQVRDRYLRNPGLLVRGPDRFAHGLLEANCEALAPALGNLRVAVEQLEEGVLRHISAAMLFPRVVRLRKDLSRLRQLLRPQAEVMHTLTTIKTKLVRSTLLPYLRDVHTELKRMDRQAAGWGEQVILSFRIYLNKSGYEANQGIRVITGITALTLPPLLIGSWFGMNFTAMHELTLHDGYAVALALTVVSVVGMAFWMRRKHWL